MSVQTRAGASPVDVERSRIGGLTIAGRGAITSVGRTARATFEAMCAGDSGLEQLRGFDRSRFGVQHAYEIDDRREHGRDEVGRATRWLLSVIAEAASDAGIADLTDVPIVIGTGLRELRSLELSWTERQPFDPAELDFRPALRHRFGATRVYCFANACSASLYALAVASDLIELGEADHAIVAGVDSISTSMFGLLDRVQLQAPAAVRPFDRDRRGVLMGDGAAAIVIRAEATRGTNGVARGPGKAARGTAAAARGRLLAVAVNSDAYHVTAPSAGGIADAISDAHRRAGVRPQDVDLILLHGTGTPLNDDAEARAIAAVFAEHASTPSMTALKSLVGHTSGSSGLLSLVVGLEALATGRIPPTLGLVNPIDAVDGWDIVRERERRAEVRIVEVHAFGFGGVNAVAIVDGEVLR